MRWVFYSLVVVNLVYLGWQLALGSWYENGHYQGARFEGSVVSEQLRGEPISGPKLRLLREAPQPRRGVAVGSAERHPGACPVVGPWSAADDAERARIQLAAAGLEGNVQTVQVEKDRLSWVYLPAYKNREQALAMLSELQALGIDSFIIKSGADANAISLGYFSSPESAEGLRVKMRNAGYPAFVRETSRSVTEYWLYLPSQAAEAGALKDFLVGNPDVARDRAACDMGLAGFGA